MRFKRLFLSLTILCFSLCATGCGDTLYTMTEEEETLITLYAAKMVSKFNMNQTTGICPARIRDGELDDVLGTSSDEDDSETSTEKAEVLDNEQELTETEENSQTTQVDTEYSLTDAINIDGMEFDCMSLDVTDEFNVNESFVLTKTSGMSYVVLYLYGTNTSEGDIDFSTISSHSYRLAVNGSAYVGSTNSFSDYDLSLYDGSVAAGETVNFILVFQVNDSSISEENTVELVVSSDGLERGTSLNISQQ